MILCIALQYICAFEERKAGGKVDFFSFLGARMCLTMGIIFVYLISHYLHPKPF